MDVDYKALSNAGIWMIGRLQTQQDKDRLLDGLRVASGTVDPAEYDRLISSLGKRTFVFHNVHKPQPVIFQTRYTMNYLAGPLMRTEIPQLNQLAGVTDLPALSQAAAPAEPGASSAPQTLTPRVDAAPGLSGKPSVPAGVSEIILPTDLTVGQAVEAARVQLAGVEPEGILYRPTLLAQAEIRYLARKYNLEHIRQLAVLLTDPGTGLVRWEDFTCKPIPPTAFASQPLPDSRFETLPNWLSDAKRVKTYESDFTDWVYRTGTIRLRANEALGVYASPETSPEEFRKCAMMQLGKPCKPTWIRLKPPTNKSWQPCNPRLRDNRWKWRARKRVKTSAVLRRLVQVANFYSACLADESALFHQPDQAPPDRPGKTGPGTGTGGTGRTGSPA